ncbi:hypothetical protein [Rhodoferax sp.]|uniref:hypothetical protein n=1 Tax=Rhodoferax sp. TaxID=50421 RepID=UPI0025E296AB|nr:hypothetical protein [Rhodoferax sp.]
MLHFKWIAPAIVAVGLLAACGGGDDGPPATQYVSGTGVPVGAVTNVNDVIAFTKAEIANTSDSRDPVVLGDSTTLATSDSADPAEI